MNKTECCNRCGRKLIDLDKTEYDKVWDVFYDKQCPTRKCGHYGLDHMFISKRIKVKGWKGFLLGSYDSYVSCIRCGYSYKTIEFM